MEPGYGQELQQERLGDGRRIDWPCLQRPQARQEQEHDAHVPLTCVWFTLDAGAQAATTWQASQTLLVCR